MQAVGTYITVLRDANDMTQLDVATAIGSNPVTIWRYETGKQKRPDMSLLFKIVAVVRGRGDDIMKLILADDPTDDYARALAAEAQLSSEDRERVGLFAGSDEETIAFLEAAYELSQHNKTLMREVRGYINGLASRVSQPPTDTPPSNGRRRRRAK